MGCVVSSDDRRRIIGVSHHHHHHQQQQQQQHIVSLTSSTYGILTGPRAYSDIQPSSPPPPPPPPPPPEPSPEVINSWELMAGLVDPPPSTPAAAAAKSKSYYYSKSKPHRGRIPLRPIDGNSGRESSAEAEAVLLYTTSLRGVRSTFEACNAVRAALQAHGVAFRERDVSMDRGFRDELRGRLLLLHAEQWVLPRLFVRGRLVDEVLRLDQEGALAPLLDGLPKASATMGGGSYSCDGCGGMRFLPCFDCSGSRKLALPVPFPLHNDKSLMVRCRECNENGLVLCPICS